MPPPSIRKPRARHTVAVVAATCLLFTLCALVPLRSGENLRHEAEEWQVSPLLSLAMRTRHEHQVWLPTSLPQCKSAQAAWTALHQQGAPSQNQETLPEKASKRAIAVVVTSADESYLRLIAMLGSRLQTIRQHWHPKPEAPETLALVYGDTLTTSIEQTLIANGFKIVVIPPGDRWVPAYHARCAAMGQINSVYADQYLKLFLWRLTQYSKILYLDADHILFPSHADFPDVAALGLSFLLDEDELTGCPLGDHALWNDDPTVSKNVLNGAFFVLRPSMSMFRRLTTSGREDTPSTLPRGQTGAAWYWRQATDWTRYQAHRRMQAAALQCTEMGVINAVFSAEPHYRPDKTPVLMASPRWRLPTCYVKSICFDMLEFIRDPLYRVSFTDRTHLNKLVSKNLTEAATDDMKIWLVHGVKGTNADWYEKSGRWASDVGADVKNVIWEPFMTAFARNASAGQDGAIRGIDGTALATCAD